MIRCFLELSAHSSTTWQRHWENQSITASLRHDCGENRPHAADINIATRSEMIYTSCGCYALRDRRRNPLSWRHNSGSWRIPNGVWSVVIIMRRPVAHDGLLSMRKRHRQCNRDTCARASHRDYARVQTSKRSFAVMTKRGVNVTKRPSDINLPMKHGKQHWRSLPVRRPSLRYLAN